MRALSGGGIVDMALRVRASPPRLLRLPGVVDFAAAAAAAADDDDDSVECDNSIGAIDIRCLPLDLGFVMLLPFVSRPAAKETRRFVEIPPRVVLRELTMLFFVVVAVVLPQVKIQYMGFVVMVVDYLRKVGWVG